MDRELTKEQILDRLRAIEIELAQIVAGPNWHTTGQFEYMTLLDEQEYLYADLAAKERAGE